MNVNGLGFRGSVTLEGIPPAFLVVDTMPSLPNSCKWLPQLRWRHLASKSSGLWLNNWSRPHCSRMITRRDLCRSFLEDSNFHDFAGSKHVARGYLCIV